MQEAGGGSARDFCLAEGDKELTKPPVLLHTAPSTAQPMRLQLPHDSIRPTGSTQAAAMVTPRTGVGGVAGALEDGLQTQEVLLALGAGVPAQARAEGGGDTSRSAWLSGQRADISCLLSLLAAAAASSSIS